MIDSHIATLSHDTHNTFVPPAYETPHVVRQFQEVMKQVAETIAPVWPLKDYVAVNPYAGISERSFMDARSFLQVFSDCETLMPVQHYADQFQKGQFNIADLAAAIGELKASGFQHSLSAEQIAENLQSIPPAANLLDQPAAVVNHNRHVRTIADYATSHEDVDWSEAIRDEVSKHCSAHYDEGQATWSSPFQHLTLYQAWRTVAARDRNIEILGLTGFCQYAANLPHTPEAAIIHSLQQLKVPQSLWSAVLLCQAFSIPGWSAWAKYQVSWKGNSSAEQDDLAGLLAIRLAYDAALAQAKSISVNWSSLAAKNSVSFPSRSASWGNDSVLRYTCLRASEIGIRNKLLESLSFADNAAPKPSSQRKLAQMVFCIDVRSERIRRQLESVSGEIETLGFAGFFGMPIEFVPMGETHGNSHVPVLLNPQFKLFEGLHDSRAQHESEAVKQRKQIRSWRALWKKFQSSAVGCFSFVETAGLFFAFKLAARAIGCDTKPTDARFAGLAAEDHGKLGPTLRALNHQGITTSHQADLAESMLRNLGLTKDFALLVVFCGHASQTDNNPLAAGLDCGACGGHSGQPNARLAAMLLNQPYIRSTLADRGIVIPEDTYFLGGLHNTTTDWIEYFDLADVPTTHANDVRELIACSMLAGKQTRQERLPIVASKTPSDLVKRASDWSEVRPEWGLAGNAAFIVAGKSYWLKHTTRRTTCEVEAIRFRTDVNTHQRAAASSLALNEIGRCEIKLHDPVMYDAYSQNRQTGSFILVDRITHETVAAGMFVDPHGDPATPGHWDEPSVMIAPQLARNRVSAAERATRYGQKPITILVTGLSSSGKTSVAMALEARLFDAGRTCIVLDGQSLRLGISRDLGFSAEERSENLRRAAEIAKLINDSGQICIAAFVAPSAWVRSKARQLIGEERFFHVHLETPVGVCRDRDITGQYQAADKGEIASFPGVTFNYETPTDADLTVNTQHTAPDEIAASIMKAIKERSLVPILRMGSKNQSSI